MANLTPFSSPSPLLAHQYHHHPPAIPAAAANPCTFLLAFADLSYTVEKPPRSPCSSSSLFSKNKQLNGGSTTVVLDSVSGEVATGEVLAVMGASGSGKTTLIDALADRLDASRLRGSITLNGDGLRGRLLRAISAYVMQDDLLFPMLTVEETLEFAASVRLPRAVSVSRKKERVQVLIDQLGLRQAAKTIIGDEGHRGVSGGERRRVSIGTEIVHDPVILFLDEPTSGLDSTSALMAVQVLRRIARAGSIVVMSIHQPGSRVLELVDRLLILTRGRAAYSGPPRGLPEFFAVFGAPIPDGVNPAEFALDVVFELEHSDTDGGTDGLVALNVVNHEARRRTQLEAPPCLPLRDAVRNCISSGRLVSGAMFGGAAAATPAAYANPVWAELSALTKRSLTNMWRATEIYALSLGQVLVFGVLLATIFWRLGDAPEDSRERAVFFTVALSTILFSSVDTLAMVIQDRYIHQREMAYNAYRRSSYAIANAITTFLPLVGLAFALTAMTFFTVGLSGGMEGLIFFFVIILAAFWAGSGLVTFVAGAVSHLVVGYTVAAASFCYFVLLGGFFISRSNIPWYWIWLHYISLVKYSYEALMQNEFGGESAVRCFTRGPQVFDGTSLAVLPAAMKLEVLAAVGQELGTTTFDEAGCLVTGLDVLRQQEIGQLGKWSCVLVIVAWGFLFRLLFFACLVFGGAHKRK